MEHIHFVVTMIVVGIVIGYALMSFLFLKQPLLIHKKKRSAFKATHISHRGGAGENLENTVTAFQHAVDLGTDMLEIDCQITKDKQVVVCHDNNLTRATGQDVLIHETLYKDLPRLKQRLPVDFKPGHMVDGSEDRQIPLLRDVMDRFPNVPINIDIKRNDDDLIHKVSMLVNEFDRASITVWGNHSDEVTQKCFKQNPDISLFFSMRRVFVAVVLYYTGLLPFMPLRESFYEITMPSALLREGVISVQPSWSLHMKVRLFDWLLMNKSMFKHFTERGIQVYLWVMNTEGDFERAYDLGVTGVMTDFPSKLRTFLTNHPHITAKA